MKYKARFLTMRQNSRGTYRSAAGRVASTFKMSHPQWKIKRCLNVLYDPTKEHEVLHCIGLDCYHHEVGRPIELFHQDKSPGSRSLHRE